MLSREEMTDFELHNQNKERRSKKLKSKSKKKNYKMEKTDNFLGKAKPYNRHSKDFKNNRRNLDFDIEEDYYDPQYY